MPPSFLDPDDTQGFADNALELLNNPDKVQAIRERGFEQVKKFSWRQTAEHTLEIYRAKQ